jgi:hypothetical protein
MRSSTGVPIPRLVYDRDGIGGGTHENLDGQELDPHVDFNCHPLRSLHRRLNLMVFPNPEWQEPWGGCRELESDPWRPERKGLSLRILSCLSRTVAWFSRRPSPLGMASAAFNCPPVAGGGRAARSQSTLIRASVRESKPPHRTARSMCPGPWARTFQPGYTLRPEDVQEPEVPIGRRDHQIRYLYERELDFSTPLTGVYRSPSFRVGRTLSWPPRWLRGRWKPKPATAGTPGPRR